MFSKFVTVGLLAVAFMSSASAMDSPLQRRACNADNCARAVTGTVSGKQPDLASRRADCSSFYSVTITPVATTTVTSYTSTSVAVSTLVTTATAVTTTVVVTTQAQAAKRQAVVTAITASPSNVPAYASPCSGTARYSSACSCFIGTSRGTSFAPTSTSTVVVYAVTTANTVTVQTATTTVITTLISTTRVAPQPVSHGARCDYDTQAGCQNGCGCDPIYTGQQAGQAFCYTPNAAIVGSCSSNSDCAADYFCDTDFGQCVQGTGCTSSYTPPSKRSLIRPDLEGTDVGALIEVKYQRLKSGHP